VEEELAAVEELLIEMKKGQAMVVIWFYSVASDLKKFLPVIVPNQLLVTNLLVAGQALPDAPRVSNQR
jgi:fructoselysine-6-P-deglycase FrlB-like protein